MINRNKESIMRCQARQVLVFSLYAIILAASTGCAGSGEVVYRPVLRPDMTYAAAVSDLQNAARSGKIVSATGAFTPVRSISNIIVNEDGTVKWEFDPEPRKPGAIVMSLLASELDFTVDDWGPAWKIILPHFMITGSLPELQKVADDLYCIQQKLKNLAETWEKELALFEPVAAEYRSQQVKPQISEEQRKWIVQANAQSQEKQYLNAIDLYEKAIALDPVSYPAAYFNLALLSAQENAPRSAIYYMKHYLLLAPDAPDARSAQDKIYEWELMVQK